jgi:polysaccharide biosynthesis protein PslF
VSAQPSTQHSRAGGALALERDTAHGAVQLRRLGYDRHGEVAVGFVGTFPPTKCGIASFTESLREAMASPDRERRLGVVSCVDEPGVGDHPPAVVAELVRCSAVSLEAAAAALNGFDVVIVQHEFGIFGGRDGRDVVDLVAQLTVPVIVVLHTVLERPSPAQREIVEQLAGLAEFVVAQSKAARARLLAAHTVEPERVRVIPHGACANLSRAAVARDSGRRPLLLTWGLIGPGKGIEFVIDALAKLRDLDPPPRYVVAGQTHPRVLTTEGESYRESLIERARLLGVDGLVEFDDGYRPTEWVLAQARAADIVVLPYRSRDQVVSGVLVEAMASGTPVVATRFPHAIELLADGAGILVAHEDPEAIAAALRSLLTDTRLAGRAAAAARKQAKAHHWETVGRAYRQLAAAAENTCTEGAGS